MWNPCSLNIHIIDLYLYVTIILGVSDWINIQKWWREWIVVIIKIVGCHSLCEEKSLDACHLLKHLDYLEESMCESLSNCLEKCMTIIWSWVMRCETLASCEIVLTRWKLAVFSCFKESPLYLTIIWCGDNFLRLAKSFELVFAPERDHFYLNW